MKKTLVTALLAVGATPILLNQTASADVLADGVRTIFLAKPSGPGTPMSVAYHPGFRQYYSGCGGQPSNGGAVYDSAGNLIQDSTVVVDLRALNYNSNRGLLEAVTFGARSGGSSHGLFTLGLDGVGFYDATRVQQLGAMSGMFDDQTMPAYNASDNTFYSSGTGSGTVNVVDGVTGHLVTSISLDLGGGRSNSYYSVGYDENEDRIIIADTNLDQFHVFDLAGAFIGSSSIDVDAAGTYGFGYTNGQAFVYDYAGNGWQGYQILEPTTSDLTGTDAGANFGGTVARIGDLDDDGVSDFLCGAPMSDARHPDGGLVEVFSGATFDRVYRKLPQQEGDRFGWAVTGVGDINGDDADDFAVGAPYFAQRRGRVYVYSGADGGILHMMTGSASSDFGHAVSGGHDIDHDGTPDIIVGAPRDDSAGTDAGRVSIFSGVTGDLIGTFSGERANDHAGWSVAALGVSDDDAYRDFVVGAPGNDERASNAGKVYVVSGRTMTPIYSRLGFRRNDLFGNSVAALGRLNAGAREDFAVGTPLYDGPDRINTGRVDVYEGSTGDRLFVRTGQAADDRFGSAVVAGLDVDDDGFGDLLVGAPRHDTVAENAGRAYIYSGHTGALFERFDGDAAQDFFGWSLAGLGDIRNDDGFGELIVAEPFSDTFIGNGGLVTLRSTGAPSATAPADGALLTASAVDPGEDLRQLVLAWGEAAPEHDADGDGEVGMEDLLALIASW